MRFVVVAWLALMSVAQADEGIRSIGKDPRTGTALAVLVTSGGLTYSGQMLPLDRDGKVIEGDAAKQLAWLMEKLPVHPVDCAKLNFYVANPDVAETVQEWLSKSLKSERQPAVSFVQTRLPIPGALVAVDLVSAGGSPKRQRFKNWPRTSLIESRSLTRLD